MKCSVCGRKLRSPKSQEVGYGPICYKRLFGSNLKSSNKAGPPETEAEANCDIPRQMSLDDYLQMFQK